MADIYSRDEVMRKVQLLLNLAEKAGTKEEAESALAKAHTLMLKYSIEEHELGNVSEDDATKYRDLLLYRGKVRSYQHKLICSIIDRYFNVKVYSYRVPHKETRTFAFGTETNTEFAKHAHDFLCHIFESLWEKQKEKIPWLGKEHARSYYAGLANGFEETLQKEMEKLTEGECTALVVIGKELVDATKKVHPDLKSTTIRFNTDGKKQFFSGLYEQGVRDGKQISIRKRIGESNS